MSESNKRFLVALSFPGEHRAYVAQVSRLLGRELGDHRVLYDKFHEAEFARPDLDIHLQTLYHDQSELVVVFLCADYERKEWPGLEWRAIRDLIKRKRAASIMVIRFDSASVPGVFSIDGYISAEGRKPTDIAALILDRLQVLLRENAASGVLVGRESLIPLRQREVLKKRRFHNVPTLPPNYLVRDEVEPLKRALLGASTASLGIVGAAWRAGLFGMGGIGKTVLAAALAHDHEVRAAYPDGVFWLTFGRTPDVMGLQAELAQALGSQAPAFRNWHEGRQLLRELTETLSGLVILDDVWEPEHAGAFHRLGEGCRLLVTTRNAEVLRLLGADPHHIDVLRLEAALVLLARYAGQPPATLPLIARDVARECGCLPLALAVVGSLVRAGHNDWREVLERLKRADLKRLRAYLPEYENVSVFAALDMSVEALPEPARAAFIDCAVFPEEVAVPEKALHTFWSVRFPDPADAADAAQLLLDRSLLSRDDDRRYRLHDLYRDYVQAVAREVEGLIGLHRRWLAAYQQLCDGAWATGPDDGYFFEHLPYHLEEAGEAETLAALLLDYDWIEAKLRATDVGGLLADYTRVEGVERETRLVQHALRLSSPFLASDPAQLASQLIGRLRGIDRAAVQGLVTKASRGPRQPWLQPQTASLAAPGSAEWQALLGHKREVPVLILSQDGHSVVSGSNDRTCRVWDLTSGSCVNVLKGHTKRVTTLAHAAAGRYVISGSWDGTCRVWDLAAALCVHLLKGHTGGVTALACTVDGGYAVSGSVDHTCRVWDLAAGRCVRVLKGHTNRITALAFTAGGHHVVSGSWDGTCRVWDLVTGRCLHILKGHTNRVNALVCATDGRYVVSGSSDGTCRVWDLVTGRCVHVLKGHAKCVGTVACTDEGRYVVSGSWDGSCRVWDLASGRSVHLLQGHASRVITLACTSDGRYVISGSNDHTCRVWELETGRCVRVLTGHADRVTALACAVDGAHVVSSSWDRTCRVWDLAAGVPLHSPEGHTLGVTTLACSGNGRYAVSGSIDHTCRVWDLRGACCVQVLEGHKNRVTALACTADGRYAISAADDHTCRVWNLETGRCIHILEGHPYGVTAVACTPDGRYAVSGGADRCRVWDLTTGRCTHVLDDRGTVLICGPDGPYAISSGNLAQHDLLHYYPCRVWDLTTGRCLQVLGLQVRGALRDGHTSGVTAIIQTPDGRYAVSGSIDHKCRVWDLATGRCRHILEGHLHNVTSLACAPDGRYAVSGSRDRTCRVWNVSTGRCVHVLEGHTGGVTAVACTADGRYVVSGSNDHTCRIWDMDVGRLLATFSTDAAITRVAALDQSFVIAGSANGAVHILTLRGV